MDWSMSMSFHALLRSRLVCLGVTTGLFTAMAVTMKAQQRSSPALFLETLRDPGSPDVPATARSLALGGIRFGTGDADDGPTAPAMLRLRSGSDVAVSAGPYWYGRDELVATPDQFPPRNPAREAKDRSTAWPVFVAVATRRQLWAASAFYDGSSRFEESFDTAKSSIFFQALQGTFFSADGTGHASVAQRATRLGGAVAVGPASRRAAAGIAVYAVRLDYDVLAHVHVDTESSIVLGPIVRGTMELDNRVTFLGWGPGIVLSAMAQPVRRITIAGRWERNPEFEAVHTLQESTQVVNSQPVRFQMPSTYGAGLSIAAGRTTIAGEVARTNFSQAFQPIVTTTSGDSCVVPLPRCPGWGIANYATEDATSWRIGIEHSTSRDSNSWLIRGGAALESGYTLARPTSDPLRNGGSAPAPPFLADYEPPRDAAIWLTGGLAYRWRDYEIGMAGGRSDRSMRWLADFRARLR
jgi:hypothetical protein